MDPDSNPTDAATGGRPHVVLNHSAIVKGWAVAVSAWLAGSLVLFWWSDATGIAQSDTLRVPDLEVWPSFAVASVWVALVAALPLGVALAWLLRPVRRQRVHVAVFFAVPATVLAGPFALTPDAASLGLVFGAALGLCSAVGRAAVVRDAARRPPESTPDAPA